MSGYAAFLQEKRIVDPPTGHEVPDADLAARYPRLFDWQRELVGWALRRGRAALFADTGLGKTAMQAAWAQEVVRQTGGDVLILAPLAVGAQTVGEAAAFGIRVTQVREVADLLPGINVTNYERLARFTDREWAGVVLDESSILKGFDGSTRKALTAFAQEVAYRLCCTATPAPNDLVEIANHAEFLGVMQGDEMLALYFTQDGNSTQKWRLKGHARRDFWRWMASWSVAVRRPSDLGHEDGAFLLPHLDMRQVTVGANVTEEGRLFGVEAQTLSERRAARRESLEARVAATVALVLAEPAEPWVVWCDLNAESESLARAIPGAVEIRGSDTPEHKEQTLRDFSEGRLRVLVTKPSIAGFGLNWQHCARMAFVGLSDSYEALYQAVRRCWRFGQRREVHAFVITAETEGAVVRNIERKERQAAEMMGELVAHMGAARAAARDEQVYERDVRRGTGWTMHLGDSVEVIDEVADESVGLIVFSPPFPGMYVYTNSPRDLGNSGDVHELVAQFRYLMPGMLRVLKPGRTCAIHLTQGMDHKSRGGRGGLIDFRGEVIRAMQSEGFVFYGEVTIDKDPQVKAIRTKDRGLLFKTLASDSSHMRMALADYILQFRKPGENAEPIAAGLSDRYGNTAGWITPEEWIEWAAPVWYGAHRGIPGGIRETDVLNVSAARDERDERHLCPLQLGVIERAVKLWSNPGDVVLSPFAGIGSEGVGALRFGRKFVGIELKRSYWETACRNLTAAEGQMDLFGEAVS